LYNLTHAQNKEKQQPDEHAVVYIRVCIM